MGGDLEAVLASVTTVLEPCQANSYVRSDRSDMRQRAVRASWHESRLTGNKYRPSRLAKWHKQVQHSV